MWSIAPRSGWRSLAETCAGRADQVASGLGDIVAEELAHLERVWPHDMPHGVIHADLFPDNVFFLGEKLTGLIDFYFACDDLFAFDIAVCLNAWCFEADGSYNVTKGRALLTGYGSVRALAPEEVAALPLLARGAALRFLLTRLVDWLDVPPGALVRQKDPLEYLKKLRFHRRIDHARDYGLAA
jgi:homoserine kinase type II